MRYMWLGLGILGLIVSLLAYRRAEVESLLYELSLWGYLFSWVALVYGTWSVLA